jgi:excinuclease UvrABC ATPase subunit
MLILGKVEFYCISSNFIHLVFAVFGSNVFEKQDMNFLADLYVPCTECEGKRFEEKVIQVKVDGHSIHDVLNLAVDQAFIFFYSYPLRCKGL